MKPWNDSEAGADPISQFVYLSNLIGSDLGLVQPGGGNTSVKLEEEDIFGNRVQALVVKGSGTDLRTITASGFTHLYMGRLAVLQERGAMSDEDMMALMRACMLFADRDPVPSVETPLHSLLPFKYIAHTHDVASLSLTDTPSARDHVQRAFGGDVAFLEYVRPGFPLAKRMAEQFRDGPPPGAIGLAMEKHGLAAWGVTARECYENLASIITRAEAYVAEARHGRSLRSARPEALEGRAAAEHTQMTAAVAPIIRGSLVSRGYPCVLAFDDSPELLEAISRSGFPEIAARGVMTPEHILRVGVRPLVFNTPVEAQQLPVAAPLRDAIAAAHAAYTTYAAANIQPNPIPDWLKVIAVPGIGVFFAGKDRRNALVARDCFRATVQVQDNAEAVERFEFLSDADACEMEYWPLERRKIEESAESRKRLDGKVALIIGGASGIGRATALRFAAEGAHVAVADLDGSAAEAVAAEINAATPDRALSLAVDVTPRHSGESRNPGAADDSIDAAVHQTLFHFGGLDILFYSPGIAPELHPVSEMDDAEIRRQLAVHYEGAVAATREASRVMLAQGNGGRLIYNASKAAFAPGENAAAYGASKAALVHYVRNTANELSRHGITASAINADAVDTPLFRRIVAQRAAASGQTEEQTLQRYADRSIFREATVPAEAVAEAALWLASDASRYTSGCVITVGGGAEGMPR
jgi:rhamnose utilization protein RhaD (predicted bifunctional aldolase and dehydrogenase)/NAD(P)-dependent dehydrogenase (short-subunit alcohol dehydrogenase family)